MKEIQLTQGKIALVDDADFERVNAYKWCYANGYAATRSKDGKRGGKNIYMHSFITGVVDTDHIDFNGLNNQRHNLRAATRSQQQMHRRVWGQRKYKGVYLSSPQWGKMRAKPWFSQIQIEGKQIHLGYFLTEEEGAIAYNEAAIKLFGEFAVLNNIQPCDKIS